MKGILITVNYNNFENIKNYINSVFSINKEIDIYIYDNNSDQEYKQKIKEYLNNINFKNIKFIESDLNIGYFPAIRKVYDKFIKNENFDYLIVSNNDIFINDKLFFEKLEKYLDKYHVIAPRIISLISGKDQNPYRETSIKKIHKIAYKIYYSNIFIGLICYYLREFLRLFEKRKIPLLSEREIFGAHGSFIIFTKKFFENGGYIEDSNFLYGEEDSITGICLQHNMKIGFVPELIVYHDEHKTTNAHSFKIRNYCYLRKAYKNVKEKFPQIY